MKEKYLLQRHLVWSIKTNSTVCYVYAQFKNQRLCRPLIATGGNLVLTESEKANVLLETFKDIFHLPDKVGGIRDIPEFFAAEVQSVTE